MLAILAIPAILALGSAEPWQNCSTASTRPEKLGKILAKVEEILNTWSNGPQYNCTLEESATDPTKADSWYSKHSSNEPYGPRYKNIPNKEVDCTANEIVESMVDVEENSKKMKEFGCGMLKNESPYVKCFFKWLPKKDPLNRLDSIVAPFLFIHRCRT